MGANAQTTVPTFTAGQVLTAAQLNDSARTGVPVFADTTARDAGFGGAGEKALAEGQLAYIESLDVVQYYSGASWLTVGPQTLSSGLNYVTGATFTTVSSVSLPNSTFTSTYANYRLLFQVTAYSTDATLSLRMRASGTDDSAASYIGAFIGLDRSSDTARVVRTNNATSLGLGTTKSVVLTAISFDIYSPQLANKTHLLGGFYNTDGSGFQAAYSGAATFDLTTSFDALSVIVSGGTMTGRYRVYGYSDS